MEYDKRVNSNLHESYLCHNSVYWVNTGVPGKHLVPGEKFHVLLIDMAARPYNKFKLISDNEDTEEAERL